MSVPDVPPGAGTGATGAGQGAPRVWRRAPILVRHQGLRHVSDDELLHALGGLGALEGVPVSVEIDTAEYAAEIDSGSWGPSHGDVWRHAGELRELLRRTPNARLIYAGMPEVPHAVALGAYLGDEWVLEPYDFQVNGTWAWPETKQTLSLGVDGLPHETISTAGPAVLRVGITAKITDEQVRKFVGEAEQIADVRIAPLDTTPQPGLVRSPADVAEARRAVRQAVAALIEHRPQLTVLHLFIAAPVSACVVTGQEMRIRNNPPVQTYRYRQRTDGTGGATTEAIRITVGGPAVVDVPLTAEPSARAAVLRGELWTAAIRDVERYAERKRGEATRARRMAGGSTPRPRWYDVLVWGDEGEALRRLRPFPALPPVYEVIEGPASVDPVPMVGDAFFGFQREDKVWRVNDRFSVRLDERFPDAAAARALLRIFLFHEYLHVVHGITKASVEEVGKFANGLERADYMCDLYGVLHELDWEVDEDPSLARDFDRFRRRLGDLIDLVVRSFWAFEPEGPMDWMEIRRMRRYMNWYWQQVRVRMARTPLQLAAVLARQPVVEIAGLEPRAESRRYYGSLRRFDRGVGLELGIVLDSEQLHRVKTGVTTPLDELARAFREHDHGAIQQVFRAVYAEAEGTGHALPREEHLP